MDMFDFLINLLSCFLSSFPIRRSVLSPRHCLKCMMYYKTKLNVPLKIPELTAKTNLKTPYSAGNGKRSSILLRSHLNGTDCGSQADSAKRVAYFWACVCSEMLHTAFPRHDPMCAGCQHWVSSKLFGPDCIFLNKLLLIFVSVFLLIYLPH